MNLLKAWQDSLDIFRPSNFKLFLLVTLHSAWQSYKVFIKYFWWLLIISVGGSVLLPQLIIRSPLFTQTFVTQHPIIFAIIIFLAALSGVFVAWFGILASRASTQKKDFSYFLSYTKHFLHYALGSILIFIIFAAFFLLFWKIIISFLQSSAFILKYLGVIRLVLNLPVEVWKIIACLSVLFFVGGSATISNFFHSIWRSIKFFIYNIPFWIIGYCLPAWGLQWVAPYIAASGSPIALFGQLLYGLCLFILPICYITNFYIKKMHEQRSLYYSE